MSDQTFLFEQALKDCHAHGLNLSAVIDLSTLPNNVCEGFSVDLAPYARLVMLGNAGRLFWKVLDAHGWEKDNPVDTFSLERIETLIAKFSQPSDKFQILYPLQPHLLPLQQLGKLAGWGEPSPIGNSINPEYGLWFAFRGAFLTTVELPATSPLNYRSPCETCIGKPCQKVCPAGAVQNSSEQFKLNACIDHRIKAASTCHSTCLARLACPIGRKHRYPPHAIHYLYSSSVKSIAAWRDRNLSKTK